MTTVPDHQIDSIIQKKTNPYEIVFHGPESNDAKEYDSKENIDVFITQSSNYIGAGRFFPLFKYINFSSDISYRWSVPTNKKTTMSNTGSFKIKGNYNIFGICTGKMAKQLVLKCIEDGAKKIIQQNINKKLEFKEQN